jgi:hypothetical protein
MTLVANTQNSARRRPESALGWDECRRAIFLDIPCLRRQKGQILEADLGPRSSLALECTYGRAGYDLGLADCWIASAALRCMVNCAF